MKPCAACGLLTLQRLCHFDRRTAEFIRLRRCVSCQGPVFDQDHKRTQGKCPECVGRNNRLSASTRWVLREAAIVRHQMAA